MKFPCHSLRSSDAPPGIGLSHLMPVWLLFALHLLVLILLQVFVQVFVVAVKNGLVDHFGRG